MINADVGRAHFPLGPTDLGRPHRQRLNVGNEIYWHDHF